MRILFLLETNSYWMSGIWWHRCKTPAEALKKRGHEVRYVPIAQDNTQLVEWADVAIFGRTYHQSLKPLELLRQFKKAGKRVIYDIDDDIWTISKDNLAVMIGNAFKDQYEGMIKEADACITPSKVLAKKLKRLTKKPIYICPNGIDYDYYKERKKDDKNGRVSIGYMGAASHWKDLTMIVDVLVDLYQKHDISFDIYGMTGEPLEASIYYYTKIYEGRLQPEKDAYYTSAINFYDKLKNMSGRHYPFMPPELHPSVLSGCDFDIGIAPLEDTEFNRGKSCVKFYEYASVGTATIASDVEPYRSEVNYRAKNNKKDWYKKLEKLILDKDFRGKIQKQQSGWVKQNRSLEALGVVREKAVLKEGGLKVVNK